MLFHKAYRKPVRKASMGQWRGTPRTMASPTTCAMMHRPPSEAAPKGNRGNMGAPHPVPLRELMCCGIRPCAAQTSSENAHAARFYVKRGIRPKGRIALEALSICATPAILVVCTLTNADQTALLSLVVVLASLGVFFATYESSTPRLRDIMPTVVLAALAAAGRILFAPIPDEISII